MRPPISEKPAPSLGQTVGLVFVYGTLRKGEERDINRLIPPPAWMGTGSVVGRLYDLGSYPGLVLGDGTASLPLVCGEVYRITEALERQLDDIEEVSYSPDALYRRRVVPVNLEPAGSPPIACLVYELAPGRAAGHSLIAAGDWVAYRIHRPELHPDL